MFRIRSVVPALGVLAVALVASAGTLKLKGAPELTFYAGGPVGMEIVGKVSGMKVADDGTNVKLSADLKTVSTGIGKRDDHAKKTLEVDKHPTVTVSVPRSSIKFPAEGKTENGKATAQVTLHGVTKSVPFTYKATNAGGAYQVESELTLVKVWKDKDEPEKKPGFGMEKPCFLGVCVKEDIRVTAKFTVLDN